MAIRTYDTKPRETHDVPANKLAAFKAEVKQTGGRIVQSAPIPTGYAVTVEY